MKPEATPSKTRFAALLLALAMLPAYAGSGMSFKDHDANKDGTLSLDEFKARDKDDLAFKAADLECDYYGCSLHKWLTAPVGTGFLYVRRDRIERGDEREQERLRQRRRRFPRSHHRDNHRDLLAAGDRTVWA